MNTEVNHHVELLRILVNELRNQRDEAHQLNLKLTRENTQLKHELHMALVMRAKEAA